MALNFLSATVHVADVVPKVMGHATSAQLRMLEWYKSNGHQASRLEPAQPRAVANSQEQSLYSFVLPLLLRIHHRRQLLAILAILAILAVLTLQSSAPATQPLLHIEQSPLKLDAICVSILV
jgi:hypothetical protein